MTLATKTISVIIIEDFKLTRVGLRCALNSNEDIEVVAECEDAQEGLSLIQRYNPDVVLMDLGLPGMNGIEATIKIKDRAYRPVFVLMFLLNLHAAYITP